MLSVLIFSKKVKFLFGVFPSIFGIVAYFCYATDWSIP